LFLRALGRDIDEELQRLAGRVVPGLGEQPAALGERFRILEEMTGYYGDVVVPSRRAFNSSSSRIALVRRSRDCRVICPSFCESSGSRTSLRADDWRQLFSR